MIKKITCIGGGATGHYMAALMAMKGYDVTLFDTDAYKDKLDAVVKKGGILLRGAMHALGTPSLVTMDAAAAIHDAQLICVHVMSDRHEEIARLIAPHIQDGQHILIIPGNLGSFIFRRVFREMGVSANVIISEKEGNLGPCRLSEPAEVTCGRPFSPTGFLAALPAADTPRALEALPRELKYQANDNVLIGTMNAGNVIMHICSTILSSTAIDRQGDDFSLFKWALTPSTFAVMKQVRDERDRINQAAGFPIHNDLYTMAIKINNWKEYPENTIFRKYMDGPNALDHRYLHEDCGCGAALAVSVASRLGIPCPLLSALLTIAGAINGRDYLASGRTLENLGFGPELSLEEILKCL